MTREELVEELNKIKNIKVKTYDEPDYKTIGVEIWGDHFKPNLVSYLDTNTLCFASSMYARFLNRTPEQVLTIVKALVE